MGTLSCIIISTLCGFQAWGQAKWTVPLSFSLGIGTLQSSELNLDSRTMSAVSIEALPSYNFGVFDLGVHFDYRDQGQVSGLESAGGTNLKGRGLLFGVGARFKLTERLIGQASFDFVGHYDLLRDTASGQDDELRSPLGLRLKGSYLAFKRFDNLTLDMDLQYLQFQKIRISGADKNAATNQIMFSLGISYIL